jgi:hypothetical protein
MVRVLKKKHPDGSADQVSADVYRRLCFSVTVSRAGLLLQEPATNTNTTARTRTIAYFFIIDLFSMTNLIL